jgi:tRNA 2-thiouridine synthesizing protein A
MATGKASVTEGKKDMIPEQQIQHDMFRSEIADAFNAQGVHVDQELNLRGKVCPYTFVESMLALEEMEIGQVLRVIVDYAPSACDVPKSLAKEGYEILDVSKISETDWAIVVRNTVFQEE